MEELLRPKDSKTWGMRFSQKALDELIMREELGRDEISKQLHTPT